MAWGNPCLFICLGELAVLITGYLGFLWFVLGWIIAKSECRADQKAEAKTG